MKFPRFNLRDLFWLVLVCALAVGWWVNRAQLYQAMNDREEKWNYAHNRQMEKYDDLKIAVRKAGFTIHWTFEHHSATLTKIDDP